MWVPSSPGQWHCSALSTLDGKNIWRPDCLVVGKSSSIFSTLSSSFSPSADLFFLFLPGGSICCLPGKYHCGYFFLSPSSPSAFPFPPKPPPLLLPPDELPLPLPELLLHPSLLPLLLPSLSTPESFGSPKLELGFLLLDGAGFMWLIDSMISSKERHDCFGAHLLTLLGFLSLTVLDVFFACLCCTAGRSGTTMDQTFRFFLLAACLQVKTYFYKGLKL